MAIYSKGLSKLGKQSITILRGGKMTERGIGFTRLYALRSEFDRANASIQRQVPPIHNQLKPRLSQVLVDLMEARKSMGAKGT